jgi:uncharacterized membrane protein
VDQHDTPEKTYDLERLIFFTDGVFAIVITLLVIELHPPEHWDRTLAGLIREEWRALLAYAASFVAVGAFWNAHRRLFRQVVRFHAALVFFNLLLMGFVVLIPFGCELIFETGPTGQPFMIYISLLATISFCQALLFGVCAFAIRVLDPRLTPRRNALVLASMLVGPAMLLVIGTFVGRGDQNLALFGMAPLLLIAVAIRRRVAAAETV